jgi:hypothetical protein
VHVPCVLATVQLNASVAVAVVVAEKRRDVLQQAKQAGTATQSEVARCGWLAIEARF